MVNYIQGILPMYLKALPSGPTHCELTSGRLDLYSGAFPPGGRTTFFRAAAVPWAIRRGCWRAEGLFGFVVRRKPERFVSGRRLRSWFSKGLWRPEKNRKTLGTLWSWQKIRNTLKKRLVRLLTSRGIAPKDQSMLSFQFHEWHMPLFCTNALSLNFVWSFQEESESIYG